MLGFSDSRDQIKSDEARRIPRARIPITQMMTRLHRQLHTRVISQHFQLLDLVTLIHYRTESSYIFLSYSFDRQSFAYSSIMAEESMGDGNYDQ